MATFVYLVKPTFSPLSEKIARAEADLISAHFKYINTIMQKGHIVLAGPANDGCFGLAIFEADSLAHAERIMAQDPIIAVGAIKGSCHAFTLAINNCEISYN